MFFALYFIVYLCVTVKSSFLGFLVHGQVTIIFVVSVSLLSVCLFVCAEFFLAVFDPISRKIGHMLWSSCVP